LVWIFLHAKEAYKILDVYYIDFTFLFVLLRYFKKETCFIIVERSMIFSMVTTLVLWRHIVKLTFYFTLWNTRFCFVHLEISISMKKKLHTLSRTSDTTETRNPCVIKVILLACFTYIDILKFIKSLLKYSHVCQKILSTHFIP
jgi:hypothetical protein